MTLHVTVVWSEGPRRVREHKVTVPAGSAVSDALRLAESAGCIWKVGDVGVWGRKVATDTPLQNGDRVECYQPLKVDPKVARRERFGQQGAKTAGLFARRRPGAKPGY